MLGILRCETVRNNFHQQRPRLSVGDVHRLIGGVEQHFLTRRVVEGSLEGLDADAVLSTLLTQFLYEVLQVLYVYTTFSAVSGGRPRTGSIEVEFGQRP